MSIFQKAKFIAAEDRAIDALQKETNMGAWAVTLIALAGSAVSIFNPQIQSAIVAHPQVGVIIAGLYAIFAHMMPSPVLRTVVKGPNEGDIVAK